ncbi:MAG: FG-GAP-like repeat-containing protein, partial [Pseudomonadota bacterium]
MGQANVETRLDFTLDHDADRSARFLFNADKAFLLADQFQGPLGPLNAGPVPQANGAPSVIVETGSDDFQISFSGGANGNPLLGIRFPDVVYNSTADEYLVVWSGEQTADGDDDVLAQRINASDGSSIGSVITIATPGGANSPNFDGERVRVAYNDTDDEYMIVWQSDQNADNQFEIYARRMDADGTFLGAEFQISDGRNGTTNSSAREADIVWNATENEYLIVWQDDYQSTSGAEIYGRRVDSDGTLLGSQTQISAQGTATDTLSAISTRVVWNATNNEYLVAWEGEATEGEVELYAQIISSAGALSGSNLRLTNEGTDGDATIDIVSLSVAWNSQTNQYFFALRGDGDTAGVNDLYGLLVNDDGTVVNGSRTNFTNLSGNLDVSLIDVVYDSVNNQFLASFVSDQRLDGKNEIFIQQISATGQAAGANGVRISSQGGDNTSFDTSHPALAFDASRGQFIVVWRGEDNTNGLVDSEQELFGQLLVGNAPAGNTAPVLTDLAASVTFLENTVNATPQLLDASVTLTDAEGNFDGGTVTLTGILAEDTVSVQNVGTGAGQIGFDGTNVSFGGVVIGTLAGGAGADLTITFNAAATTAAVEAVIEDLTYANSSDTPTASRDFRLNITDADGANIGGGGSNGFTNGGARTGSNNPFNGIDIGSQSAPTFIDVDGDGDLDLVTGSYSGLLRTFQNINGAFTELTGASNPFNGVDLGFGSTPTSVDLDGDGDFDLISGEAGGTFRAFRNDSGSFTELTGASNPFNGFDVGFYSAPTFVDVDGDGDLDLVSGELYGTLKTFENTGSGFTELTGANNPFTGMNVGFYSGPAFVDVDGDGDLDLVVGASNGRFRTFENDSGTYTELTGSANPLAAILLPTGAYGGATPTFADIDGDGDLDAVLGQYLGLISVYVNTAGVTPDGQIITVNVTPEPDNTAPTITTSATASVAENTTAVINVDATDPEGDTEGSGLTYTITGGADQALFSIDQNTGALRFIAAPDFEVPGDADTDNDYAVQVTLTDSGGLTDVQDLTVSVTNVNEAPTISGDQAIAVDEGGSVVMTAADFVGTDVDDDDATLTYTVSALSNGSVQVGGSSVTTFTQAQLTAGLVSFVHDGSETTTGGFSVSVADDDAASSATIAISATVTPVNDAPELSDFAASVTFAENTVNATPQLLDASVTLTDPEGNFDGGTVTLTGILAEDTVSVQNVGSGAGQVGFDGTNVSFGGVVIGTLAGGNGADLTITFNAAATTAAVEAVIENLTYANSSDAPTASRDFVLNVTDAEGGNLGGGGLPNGFVSGPALIVLNSPLSGIDVGTNARPVFHDLDGDGDLDLVIGAGDGGVRVFDKDDTGNGFTELTGANNPFDGVDVVSNAAPAFADIDEDGDLDLVVGSQVVGLFVFDNNDADDGFTAVSGATPLSGFGFGLDVSPIFHDLDGDGDLDLIVSESITLATFASLRVFDNNDGDTGFTELTGANNPLDGISINKAGSPIFADMDG